MIDYARLCEMDMCNPYPSTLPVTAHLDHIETFEKENPNNKNGNYYNKYNDCSEPKIITTSNIYHDFISSREYQHEDWKSKVIKDWTDDDTVSWLIEYTVSQGFCECDVPFYNFKVSGIELRNMKREEVVQRMAHPNVDPNLSRIIADRIFVRLQDRLNKEINRQPSVFTNKENDLSKHHTVESVLDLDEYSHQIPSDYEANKISLPPALDSRDDSGDGIHTSSSPSLFSYGINSKSRDQEDTTKTIKKLPGRPKGSGRIKVKRPRNVSVPEFLWNLLLEEKSRDMIDWEDYSLLKFRFIKPDEVAKLWGQMKQNDNMTFEKFSRAMRYHYRQKVLVSVPTARLVYQFGSKGPDFKTQNPNFVKVKSEDLHDISYS